MFAELDSVMVRALDLWSSGCHLHCWVWIWKSHSCTYMPLSL